MTKKQDDRKLKILNFLSLGETKTTNQIADFLGVQWVTAFIYLTDLEREGRVTAILTGGKIRLWKAK